MPHPTLQDLFVDSAGMKLLEKSQRDFLLERIVAGDEMVCGELVRILEDEQKQLALFENIAQEVFSLRQTLPVF